MTKFGFAACVVILLASAFPERDMPKVHLRGSPTFRSRSHKSLELRRSLGGTRATIGNAGSTASASEEKCA
jgi:hypothetical protein